MKDRDHNHLHPDLRPLLEQWLEVCHAQDIGAFLDEGYRSIERQNALYAQGRFTPGKIVTQAKGGQSKHNFTLNGKPASKAFDFFIQKADGSLNWNPHSTEWRTAATIGKSLGLVYGGDWSFHDYAHFQLPT